MRGAHFLPTIDIMGLIKYDFTCCGTIAFMNVPKSKMGTPTVLVHSTLESCKQKNYQRATLAKFSDRIEADGHDL